MDKEWKKAFLYGGIGFGLAFALNKIFSKKSNTSNPSITPDLSNEEYNALCQEQLVRNYQFFGDESQKKIENAFVVIVGLGGVGSHVLSAVARSGVKKIRVIDFDRISVSSLNRHAFARRQDVGKSKVEVCKEFVHSIFPHIEVEFPEVFLDSKNLEQLLSGNPNYVIDCIDNIDSKVDLVAYCVKGGIKIISACGAGMKADPTRIQIRDISDSSYDDLSRALRVKLKKKGVSRGVNVVFSTERTTRELLPLKAHQENDPDNYRIIPGYRVRIVPVFSAMPALMGQSIASYVLCDIAGQTFKPHVIDDVKSNNYQKLHQTLINKEKLKGIRETDVDFDIEDTYIITREVFEWSCVVTLHKHHGLELVQWDPTKKLNIRNIVLMKGEEAKKHEQLKSIEGYSKEITDRVQEGFKKLEDILSKRERVWVHRN